MQNFKKKHSLVTEIFNQSHSLLTDPRSIDKHLDILQSKIRLIQIILIKKRIYIKYAGEY